MDGKTPLEETAFIKGHQLYHNYIRGHESPDGKTPAECANINIKLGDNKWEKLLVQSIKHKRD